MGAGSRAALAISNQTKSTITCRSGKREGQACIGTRVTQVASAWKRRGRPQIPPEPKAGGERRWAREHPYLSHARLRCCSNTAGHGDFFGVCFLKQNYFAAPPSPAAFHWLRSSPGLPSAHDSKILLFFLPLRAKPSRMPTVSAPEPPWQVPGMVAHRESTVKGSSPAEAGAGTTALPSSPRTVCLSSRDGGSFQPIRKHLPHTACGGSQER